MSPLKGSKNQIHLMTHIVAGYPDIDTNINMVIEMEKAGADLVEIQIPFSDPLADGPTIMRANQYSLDKGTKVEDCFKLFSELKKRVSIPLLFMTYANIPFSYGMQKFMEKLKSIKADGVILPDLPFDEEINQLNKLSNDLNIPNIPVLSPDTSIPRLKRILELSNYFIYITLKVGITGTGEDLSPSSKNKITLLKKYTNLPIAAGFGISKPEHVKLLKGYADIAVVGSKLIELFDGGGIEAVCDFIKKSKS